MPTITFNGVDFNVPGDFTDKGYAAIWESFFTNLATHFSNLLNSTSTTELTIGLGSKSLTVEANKPFAMGMPVRIARTSSPLDSYMAAIVTAYTASTGAMTVNVESFVDAESDPTYTDWTISVGGTAVQGSASPLPVAEGGTAGTTPADALEALLGSFSGNSLKPLHVNQAESDVEFFTPPMVWVNYPSNYSTTGQLPLTDVLLDPHGFIGTDDAITPSVPGYYFILSTLHVTPLGTWLTSGSNEMTLVKNGSALVRESFGYNSSVNSGHTMVLKALSYFNGTSDTLWADLVAISDRTSSSDNRSSLLMFWVRP